MLGLFVKRAEPQKKEELMKTKSKQELKKPKTRKEKKVQTQKKPSGKGQELKAVINNKQRGEKIMDEKQIEERLAELEPALICIAAKLTKDEQLRENAFQDGYLAVWSKLKKGGDYNEAYLRQHAKHRMFNYLKLGSSLDNGFREITQIDLVNSNTGETIDLPHPESIMHIIYARDLKDLINKHTSGITNMIFHMFCNGYDENEIAGKLKISQKNVSRERAIVQDLVKRLCGRGKVALRKIRDKSNKNQLIFCIA